MSFREKVAWICFLAMAVVYAGYFWAVLPGLASGQNVHFAGLLISAIVILAVLQIIPIVFVSAVSPKDAGQPEDEREKLIELKGSRSGYVVLTLGALVCCVAGMFFGTEPALLANYVLLAVVMAELSKLLTQIVHYRRGS
jgi:hypothetical protein